LQNQQSIDCFAEADISCDIRNRQCSIQTEALQKVRFLFSRHILVFAIGERPDSVVPDALTGEIAESFFLILHVSLPDPREQLEHSIERHIARASRGAKRISLYKSGDNHGSLFFI
jgi:hypothetical protein